MLVSLACFSTPTYQRSIVADYLNSMLNPQVRKDVFLDRRRLMLVHLVHLQRLPQQGQGGEDGMQVRREVSIVRTQIQGMQLSGRVQVRRVS